MTVIKPFKPIRLGQHLLPSWLQDMHEFETVKVCPTGTIAREGRDTVIVDICPADQARCWTVFGVYAPESGKEGLEALVDYESMERAQKLENFLTSAFPHLLKNFRERLMAQWKVCSKICSARRHD